MKNTVHYIMTLSVAAVISAQIEALYANPLSGLQEAHVSDVDPSNESFITDVQAAKQIGEVTALIAEASVADESSELLDGGSGDTDFAYISAMKVLATVGEYDPSTGLPLTGYPDGNAAWLADEDTIRFAYQSESYATMSSETYPWEMANGASFTGSHIHTIDYDRTGFAEFLNNSTSAAEMFKTSGKLFDTVYNVFGDEVVSRASGGRWGNQTLPDGTEVSYGSDNVLSDADFFFQSFCGAYYEKAHKYGTPTITGASGCGFEDDIWLCAEEWKITSMYSGTSIEPNDTMGLASVVVDIANETAYTVPALGQTGYEKLLPMNPGCTGYVMIVCAGYNHDQEPAPLKIYIGKKGVDADGNVLNLFDPAVTERDRFLSRNGLLFGKLYGMAVENTDYTALNLTPEATEKMMDTYMKDTAAANSFSVRFYPTSYQWSGWGTANAVAVKDTEMMLWEDSGEQPSGYTFFNGDTKTEHPAVDPDITKFRYIQNMTDEGGLLAIDFTSLLAELTATSALPDYVSADVTRIVAAYDGSLTLEVGDKGLKPNGETHATDRNGAAKTTSPDGLHWIKTADADVLIVDEDSGNSQGDRKFALVLDPETLELKEDNKGYHLASAGGSANPRAVAGVAAYPGTYSRATSAEFSGSWNVTALIEKKEDGSFYTAEELAGNAEQALNQSIKLADSTLVGVVQMKGESGGSVAAFRDDQGGQAFAYQIALPVPGLEDNHVSDIDSENTAFSDDVAAAKVIGSVTATVAEASVADESFEMIDGQSGDTDYTYIKSLKTIATVGEYDPVTGFTLTGYPDGNAAWLADNDTLRFAYQSESYATMSSETYPWEMTNGTTFTGSHIHTIDYDRAAFADFLNNDAPASEMFKASGKLFSSVYNVFGDEVVSRADGGLWGNQTLPDGTEVSYGPARLLSDADFFFQSFCGAHYEKANRYGDGIGFADDAWLCAEEWKITSMFSGTTTDANDTMGLASVVVDIANETAYTVPALGQTGYEKLLPMNSGTADYVVIICAGYNHDQEPAPLKVYIGKKGVDASGNAVDQSGSASDRDKFLARNGLLYGKLFGMAVADTDYATLNITPVASDKMVDAYMKDIAAADYFSVRFYPTSYQWSGWGTSNAVAVKDTEMFRWEDPSEQPSGYTFFNGDTKTEHAAVDPDITKFRYIQNMTDEGGLLAMDFTNLVAELTATSALPDYVSADVTRIVAAYDGALTLEVGDKGIKPNGETHATDKNGAAKTTSPDGLHWIKTADADVLIVDEDSGNRQGERKFALLLNPETLELADANTGYFLSSAAGHENPRALAGAAAYPGTYSSTTSAEFSGSWNVTALLAKKEDGSFYTVEELAGAAEQALNQSYKLANSTLVGVVQMKGESGGSVAAFRDDQGGQAFAYQIDIPTQGGTITFDLGSNGIQSDTTDLVQTVLAGTLPLAPSVTPEDGYIFVGWDQDYNEVTGDMTIRAQYVRESELSSYGIFTADQLESISGSLILETNASGNIVIEIDMKTSSDLAIWNDFDLSGETIYVNADGNLELEFTPTGSASFYRYIGSGGE
ncbi:MAG: hypothetical protein ACSHX0_10725 [Akkermansiaceae bacterium]